MHGGVGEQADAVDAEVGEDLAAEADGADDAAGAILCSFAGAELLVQDDAAGVMRDAAEGAGFCAGFGWGSVDFKTGRGVVQVDESAAAFFRDPAQGAIDDFAAVAIGVEDFAGGAAGVDADQNWFAGLGAAAVEVAFDEGHVAFAAVDFTLVGDHAELAEFCLDGGFAGADDVALVAEAVADELGDGEDLHAVLLAEGDEVGDAGHFAVVAHDFADDAGGIEAGHAGEIDGGFCLAGADEDAAAAGAEGEDVAGAGEVGGGGIWRDGGLDGVGAVGGGDSGGDAFAGFNGLSEGGAEAGGVVLRHGEEAEEVGALLGEGEADEAAAVAGHEINGFRRGELGGEGEVAFVLTVLVVYNNDHAAGADFVEGAGDVSEYGVVVDAFGGHGCWITVTALLSLN